MQIYGVMVTNSGPHPSDRWAEITANQIIDTLLVDAQPNDISNEARAARKAKRDLGAKLFDIFDGHHAGVQQAEQKLAKAVKTVGAAEKHASHVDTPLDPTAHVDRVMDAVSEAFMATPWWTHLTRPEVLHVVKTIIGQHTVDVMHIERRWHHARLTAAQGA